MAVKISGPRIFENLDSSLEAIQAGPPSFVVLEVDEGQERRIAVSILRRLTRYAGLEEFTFSPGALDIREFLAARPEREREVLFLFGLANLGPLDRQRAWACLNMAREAIRASRRSFVLFLAVPHADEFPLHAPDLRACVTAHFRLPSLPERRGIKDPLAERSLSEVQDLLSQAAYYESRIAEPYVVSESRAAILRDYAHVLESLGDQPRADALREEADRLAGVTAEEAPWVLQGYLEGILKDTSVFRLADLAVQVGQQILEISFDDIYVPLRMLRVPLRRRLELPESGHPAATGRIVSSLMDTWNLWEAGKARQPIVSGDPVHRVPERRDDKAWLRFELLAPRGEGRSEPITIEEALSLATLVVLGDPGTGKSTLLRWIARIAAKRLLGQADSRTLPEVTASLRDKVPILVHARSLAARLSSTDEDPVVVLAATAARSGSQARLLEGRLRDGRCLVLVDGLDEVPVPEAREGVRSTLDALAGRYAGNGVVATSRIVGYDSVRLASPFEHVTLTDLDDGGIREFTRQWYSTISKVSLAPADESPQRRAEILFDAIAKNPGIRRIAGNPLLLTIIALIHWRGGRLPEKRAAVYEAATRTLLDNWLARRPWVKLNVDEMVRVLSDVAFDMYERGESGLIPESQLRQLFCEKLAEVRIKSMEATQGEVEHLLATLSQHCGIFLERGSGENGEILYGFLHLTFQEYLAALNLFRQWTAWVTSPDGGRSVTEQASGNPLYAHLFEPRWQEVVLLAAGRASETNEALGARFVRDVASYSDEYEPIFRRGVLLAARMLAGDVRVDEITARDICSRFVELLINSKIRSQREGAKAIVSRLGGTTYAGLFGDNLLARLGDEDSDVRWAAAEALGALKDPRAVDPLLARLGDKDRDVRRAAAEALGALKDPRALEPLLARLEAEDWGVREAAALALGQLQDPRAVDPLLARLGDKDRDVRWGAALALGQLQDPRALEPLLARLEDEDFGVRWGAAVALGELKDPRAVEPLLARLEDEDFGVRWGAAVALGQLKDPRAVEPLLARLGDKDQDVRRAAVWALGQLKDPRGLELLLARLEAEDWGARVATAWALGQLKDPRALEPLLARLGDKDQDVRRAAVWALGQLKDPRAVAALARIALRRPVTKMVMYVLHRKAYVVIEEAEDALFRILYLGAI